jgi:hypothetical protein
MLWHMSMQLPGMGLALVGLLVAGCANDGTEICPAVGLPEPGVRVSGGIAGASVRICAGAECATTTLAKGGRFVGLASLRAGQAVELVATYTAASSPVVSRIRVVPDKLQPYGPRCGDVVVATLVFDSSGHATG